MPSEPALRRRVMLTLPLSGLCEGAAAGDVARRPVPLLVDVRPPSPQARRMLDWLADKLDVIWRFQPTPWLRAQRMAAAGEALMYGLERTATRDAQFVFSAPLWSSFTWGVVRAGDEAWLRRFADLRGEMVCVARGSSHADSFRQAGFGEMKGLEAADDDRAMRMVAARRCRASLVTMQWDQFDAVSAHAAFAQLASRRLALAPVALHAKRLHIVAARGSGWLALVEQITAVARRHRTTLDRLRRDTSVPPTAPAAGSVSRRATPAA